MALKSFNEMMQINVIGYCKERDGIPYLPWAICKRLLHENGAESVYFLPVPAVDGSSLHRSEREFVDKNGVSNCCYETKIEVHIDDKTYYMTSPVMNGGNPVKDNSMSQQRVWNSMCRSFVKAVAIYTGLGFMLWAETEGQEFTEFDDPARHDIRKVQEKVTQMLTALNKAGLNVPDIAHELNMSEESLRSVFAQYSALHKFEKELSALVARKEK